jgi:hypothetical protein
MTTEELVKLLRTESDQEQALPEIAYHVYYNEITCKTFDNPQAAYQDYKNNGGRWIYKQYAGSSALILWLG